MTARQKIGMQIIEGKYYYLMEVNTTSIYGITKRVARLGWGSRLVILFRTQVAPHQYKIKPQLVRLKVSQK
jgi:hypothetical protein